MDLMNHKACLVCGSDDLSALNRYRKDHLVKCRSCSFVFSSKKPSDEDLKAFYSNYGFEGDPYFSPITAKRYSELLNEFERLGSKGPIHDAGCGFGFFVETAQSMAWEASGSELSSRAVASCKKRGLNVEERADISSGPFQVVTSFELIEHLYDPKKYVESIKKQLLPGGLLYITTPNFNGLSRYLLKEKYNVINYPEHLCYFTPKTIHQVLSEMGFEKVWLKTDGISVGRIKTSLKPSGEALISEVSADEKLRSRLENNVILYTLKHFVNKALSVLGLGVSLKALYRKK